MRETNNIERYYRWFNNNWVNVLTWAYVCFIIYLTIVPFSFSKDPDFIYRRFQSLNWNPFYYGSRFVSRSDIVANLIFFIPLGMLLAIGKLLRKHHPLQWKKWSYLLSRGALLSALVEFLQIFTYDRFPSLLDILCNAVGTVLGGLMIQAVYQKGHDVLKKALTRAFSGKPEMIMAGLFIIFIFISQLAPFTFNISLRSISRQLMVLCHAPLLLKSGPGNVISFLLIYAPFAYFLFYGIERYFFHYFKIRHYLAVLLFCLLLPLVMEIFQLLLPWRSHALTDVLLSQAGILLGLTIALFQHNVRPASSHVTEELQSLYLSGHRRFFGIIGVFYLIFLVFRIFSPLSVISIELDFKEIVHKNISSLLYLIQYHRLDLVIDMVKEIVVYLPAGFLIALAWHARTEHPLPSRLIWGIVILMPSLLYAGNVMLGMHRLKGFEIPAAGAGIWLGIVCWHLYEFIFERDIVV